MDIEEHPPRRHAIAESTGPLLILTALVSITSSTLLGVYLTGAVLNITFALAATSAVATLLLFTISLSNKLTDMKHTQSAVQNRLVYHSSPLTLAYNNILQSSPRTPETFNKEKFESGLFGWSDYTHFVKAKSDHNSPLQPLHVFMTPAYRPLSDRPAVEENPTTIDLDRQKHPRRYDRPPQAKNEWLWTDNVAQIRRESSC